MNPIKTPPWLPLADLKHILAILSIKGESRLVGGCVRDILANKESSDIDIATTILPEQVMFLMQQHNILKEFKGLARRQVVSARRVSLIRNDARIHADDEVQNLKGEEYIKCIPTGLKHGTVTVLFKGRQYEITTLRQDIDCDGRHAEVAFTADWREDAKRRDFTINAMYLDIITGQLYDYFDGVKDLANSCIRFVGQPEERIGEDYLRILRYFRFYAYFGGTNIDLPSLQACKKLAAGLKKIAGERIQQEMFKLLTAPHATAALALLSSCDIGQHLSLPNLPSLQNLIPSSEPIVNLAVVLRAANASANQVQKLSKHWRLSNQQHKLLHFLCQEHALKMEDAPPKHRAWLYNYGREYYNYLLMLQNIEEPSPCYPQRLKEAKNWVAPAMPINGNDLIELGLQGQELGNCLNHAKNCWIESDFTLQREELLKIILAKHRST